MWGFFCTDTEAVPLGSVTAWLIIWLDENKKHPSNRNVHLKSYLNS